MKKKISVLIFSVMYIIAILGTTAFAEADKTALQYIYDENISKDGSKFGAEGYAIFEQAMNDALNILNDDGASQKDIDEMTERLTQAVNGLNYYKSMTKEVIKDTWVTNNSGSGNKNFGGDTVLNAKLPSDNTTSTARQIFLGFDLSGVDPDAGKITLRTFMVKNGSNGTYENTEVYVYGCSDTSWNENSITWNNRPKADTMTPTTIATKIPGDVVILEDSSNHRWVEFDVTDYIKSILAEGKEEATIMIGTHNVGSAWFAMYSKEDESGNAAQLFFESGLDKTLGDMMEEDLNNINFESYINDVSVDRISNSLSELPQKGSNGYTISWESSRPDIMNNRGEIVALPDESTKVTMTASIHSDGVTHKKFFEMTVLEDRSEWTDEDYISKDLNDLGFSDFCSQDADKISSNIVLPEYLHSDDGVVFEWSVTNTEVASISDNMVRFTPDKKKAVSLELVVTAKRGNVSKEKRFPITLICLYGDNVIVTSSARISASSGSAYAVAASNFESYWESSAEDERPEIVFSFKNEVSLTAALLSERGNNIKKFEILSSADKTEWKTIYSGGEIGDKKREPIELPETRGKYFKVVITEKINSADPVALYSVELFNEAVTDSQSVKMDKANIVIPGVATSNITLPTEGKNGSKITWSSSDKAVISDTGVVTPARDTVYVVLTATISKGDVSDTVSGDVKVPVTANISYGGGGGGKGGGKGSGGTTVAPPKNTTTVPPVKDDNKIFNDMDETHWANTYVVSLVEKNIISKAENFRPEDNVTREEFLKLLLCAMKADVVNEKVVFADTAEGEWYYPYVATGLKMGIITGIDDETFGIGMPVKRQDMAVMAKRALSAAGKASVGMDISKYIDKDDISDYAKEAVGCLTELNVMSGSDDGLFRPNNNATRAEASKIISVLYGIFN